GSTGSTGTCECKPCGKDGIIAALKWLERANVSIQVNSFNSNKSGFITTGSITDDTVKIGNTIISICNIDRVSFDRATVPTGFTGPNLPLCNSGAVGCDCDAGISTALQGAAAPFSIGIVDNIGSAIGIDQIVQICNDVVWIKNSTGNFDYTVIPLASIFFIQ
ncbi:MAG: hypothetical protein RRY26_04855, partial [Cellulosilyticaceae bacterium]